MTSKVVQALKDTFLPIPPAKVRSATEQHDYELSRVEGLNNGSTKFNISNDVEDITKNEFITDNTSLSDASTVVAQTQRRLKNRHVQLIGISGVIGTALFVSIGGGLYKAGPAFLLLGFAAWCIPILCITVSTAEMVCYLPINSPFIRMAGRCTDDAFEFMAGWNFWFLECVQIPFEIVSVNTVIHYWRDDYSPVITLVIQVFLYFLISIFAVKVYGEVEFWLAIGKVILAVGLMFFTFITMVGGNPNKDSFGFRYWREPGAFKPYLSTGHIGYFQAFVAILSQASFTIAGPDYLSMVAGETILPRSKTLPRAFKQVFYRLTFLFLGGCLCVGILVAYDDPALSSAINNSRPGAAASPYVVAMNNLGIKILPHIVNGTLVIAAFSAGNAYTYCSSRSLYGLALDGKAPKIFTYCNKAGVPIISVFVCLLWSLLSFLQLNNNSAVVLNWIINLITASQLINFSVMCFTYLFFYKAVKAQGIDRDSFTFKSWFQPWTAIFGLVSAFTMIWVGGYTVFLKGNWDYEQFLFSYLAFFIDVGLYIFWKVLKRPSWKKSKDVDLVSGLKEIEDHEREYYEMLENSEKNQVEKNLFWKLKDQLIGLIVGRD
ncbi:General amino acid permease [Wickerhamomyces ciferrii]|uniref:General amino acid permease n=1 Tax=Wickerhamomyces ciferrii (strain ATCC 14091 / BCRC 22168 / CBS 111 / JCM 3599 / NBRC 0793 / NRRL Y-1031 F-60-10) TaxID=1206466 RepID=K0KGU0_WICCF|nr:General amino acid permease [Wickerhamomyces ciferrii]CCH42196.1 General amino acid permease [Wickerhamomyces ciferrii]